VTVLDIGRRQRAQARELMMLPPAQLIREVDDTGLRAILHDGLPSAGQSAEVNAWRSRNMRHLWRGARRVLTAKALGIPTMYGALWINVIRADGTRTELGLASLRVVTTAGCGFIVDAFQNITELENMKYHGIGTGTNAEASSDTALQTELTTQYNPSSTRATGSLGEGASANIFATTGTNTVQATVAITEHGVLSQAATGGGVLLDRSVFSAVNLNSADSIQTPYQFTQVAGS
jgi:hypothetical protein